MKQDLTWNKLIYGISDNLIKFIMKSTTNTLPTKDDLRRWGTEGVSYTCNLCGGKETARHVLSGCTTSLNQGRHTWRHNCVLKIIHHHIANHYKRLDLRHLQTKSGNAGQDYYINFVKDDGTCYVNTGQSARLS